MKLDRNINPDGKGKYALIKLREGEIFHSATDKKLKLDPEMVDFGDTPETEFFVIRLKDKHAFHALRGYAASVGADGDDPEYHQEIINLAEKARNHPNKKKPD